MIGLDGATFALLKPFCNDGVMPFLSRFIEEGVHGDLRSTRNPLTPPAWTSMITGRSPYVHGIYDFLAPSTTQDGSVFLRINDYRDIRCETLWSIAGRQGKRITSLNFYGMAPAPEVAGYLASGFVPWKHLRKGMYPESFFEMVKRMRHFDYRVLGMDIGEEKKCVQGLADDEGTGWIDLQEERDTAWTGLCCHLMETDRTDLTAVVLDGPDKVQHLFWRFLDPDLVETEPSKRYSEVRERSLGFYRKLDQNIEKLVTAAGPDTDVLMTSDHGFGPTDEILYINEWLSRQGYLRWADTARGTGTGQLVADRMKDHLGTIDWKNTVAYCPTPSSNAIYIKRDNGNGQGVKDSEYLRFCLKLQEDLLGMRDQGTGQPVVMGADLPKLEGTPYVEPSPDVTLHLRDGGFVSVVKSPEFLAPRAHIDGTHRPNGIFIARGPRIRQGVHIDPIDILDITPLLLHLIGLPVPADLEGQVPSWILKKDAAASTAVIEGGVTNSAGKGSQSQRAEPTEEEKEALMKQLKTLGYMD
jgi:predicted AlkP superfamily phosphohydrolase/phosphomutase